MMKLINSMAEEFLVFKKLELLIIRNYYLLTKLYAAQYSIMTEYNV